MEKILSKKLLSLGLAFVATLAFSSFAAASSGGHAHGAAPAGKKAMSAAESIKEVIEGNDQFEGHHDSHYFDAFQNGQIPSITVVSCADSRVHTHLFGMDPDNNIFIIRNIGNQVKNSEGSVDYGVRHLPTKILFIMGHSSCGAVKAAMGDYSGETAGIKKELDTLKPALAADDGKGDFKARWAKNVERNVDYQVKSAMKLYADKVKSGEMVIMGGVYDFNNLYGKGRGALVITNIAGETNPDKIMNNPVLRKLPKNEIIRHVGSLAPAL